MNEAGNFLNIIIPTYNRAPSLKRQLDFFINELSGENFDATILVSNNASTDETSKILNEYSGSHKINVVHQEKNLGLIGNYRFAVGKSTGIYSWIVGDDDYIKPGTLKRVIELLQQEKPGLLHIGWGSAVIDDVNNTVNVFVEAFYGYTEMQHEPNLRLSCMRIAQTQVGGFMFMTANVIRKDLAQLSLNDFRGKPNNLALPLWVALYSAHRGGFFFDKKTSIYCRKAEPRWSDDYNKLFFCDIPHIIQYCKSLGWSSSSILKKHISLVSKKLYDTMLINPRYFLYVWGLLPFRLFSKKNIPNN